MAFKLVKSYFGYNPLIIISKMTSFNSIQVTLVFTLLASVALTQATILSRSDCQNFDQNGNCIEASQALIQDHNCKTEEVFFRETGKCESRATAEQFCVQISENNVCELCRTTQITIEKRRSILPPDQCSGSP